MIGSQAALSEALSDTLKSHKTVFIV